MISNGRYGIVEEYLVIREPLAEIIFASAGQLAAMEASKGRNRLRRLTVFTMTEEPFCKSFKEKMSFSIIKKVHGNAKEVIV